MAEYRRERELSLRRKRLATIVGGHCGANTSAKGNTASTCRTKLLERRGESEEEKQADIFFLHLSFLLCYFMLVCIVPLVCVFHLRSSPCNC